MRNWHDRNTHKSLYRAGVRDMLTAGGSAMPVLIDLRRVRLEGTMGSSRRFKNDIKAAWTKPAKPVLALTPVTFTIKNDNTRDATIRFDRRGS